MIVPIAGSRIERHEKSNPVQLEPFVGSSTRHRSGAAEPVNDRRSNARTGADAGFASARAVAKLLAAL
jgi:hypothetical protein